MDAWKLACLFGNVLPLEAFEEVSAVVHSVCLEEGLLCIELISTCFSDLKTVSFYGFRQEQKERKKEN
jgi:hypothetical protein